MSETSELPLRERAKRFRARAREARLKAAQCSGEMRDAFIKLAGNWELLATEAEDDAKDQESKTGSF